MSSKPSIFSQINDISERTKSKDLPPVVLLQGTESYFLDKALEILENNLLSETEKAFNQNVFYGKEIHANDLVAACRRLPMMAKYQVIILKEAQQCRSLDQLENYVNKPVESTKLILVHRKGKIRSNSKLGKALKKFLVLTCEELRDFEVPNFVQNYGKQNHLEVPMNVAQLFLEFFGSNLQGIVQTINRIKNDSKTEGMKAISEAQFFHFASIDREFNLYELQQAIGVGNFDKTLKILMHFGQNSKKVPPVMVVSSLFNFFSKTLLALKLPSERYKMNKAIQNFASRMDVKKVAMNISILQQIDLQNKGIEGSQRNDLALLKELACRLKLK